MNFVVTFILGMIFGGATIWQMSRDNEEGAEGSNNAQATTIEVVNGADEEAIEPVAEAAEIVAEITIDQGDEPEFIKIIELDSDEAGDDSESDSGSGDDSNNEDEEAETPVSTLQQISGIGPTYASRIYDAGIDSIQALAEMSPESLQQIVTPGKSTPTAETEKWLEQARSLAKA